MCRRGACSHHVNSPGSVETLESTAINFKQIFLTTATATVLQFIYETNVFIVHGLDMVYVALEDVEQFLQGHFANPSLECSEQIGDTTFDLQWTVKQLVRQIIHGSRVSLPWLGHLVNAKH